MLQLDVLLLALLYIHMPNSGAHPIESSGNAPSVTSTPPIDIPAAKAACVFGSRRTVLSTERL